MKGLLINLAALFSGGLAGCSALNSYGIGGAPVLACVHGAAAIDDRIVGSDGVHLSLVRRFVDGDALCGVQIVPSVAADAHLEIDRAKQPRKRLKPDEDQ